MQYPTKCKFLVLGLLERINYILKIASGNTTSIKLKGGVFELIVKEKLHLKEKRFTKYQLYKADEVFLTSASSFVTPIIKIDNKIINAGKIGNISKQLSLIYFGTISND